MQCMLNFSRKEKEKLLPLLGRFLRRETKTEFEELRCSVGESTVTLYTSGKLSVQGSDCESVKEMILKEMALEKEMVLGIDETGRGENTGAFVIAGVLADSSRMRELRDSKKTSNHEEKRKIVDENALAWASVSFSPEGIEEFRKNGINLNEMESRAINCMHDFFTSLDKKTKVVADGAPLKGAKQGVNFIVGGDDKNPVVGAASVVAKTERERSSNKAKRSNWGKPK